jgi:hypothetical protein
MPSTRRSVLALMASFLGLPFAGPAAALVAPDPEIPGTRPVIRRYGRHYIINGWVLTARDLELLHLEAP